MSNMNDSKGLRVGYGRVNGQFFTEYEPESETIWGYFQPKGNACFSLGMLKDIREHDSALAANGGQIQLDGATRRVSHYVLGSKSPAVFNLGGDLALFVLLIKSRDRDALAHYAKLCIDNLYPRILNFSCPTLTTISLVQGDALGGGLECALSSDIVVAEESAQLGLPEILFNLFPGMGAYSLLARRIGMREAERVIVSGRIMSAREMYEMGIIDILAPSGEGEAAVMDWISSNKRRRNGMQAVMRARQHVHPISRDELDAITDTWVDAALRLDDRDLRMMSRIVRAQMRRMESGAEADITAEALEEERQSAAA
jgi:DSF synthase